MTTNAIATLPAAGAALDAAVSGAIAEATSEHTRRMYRAQAKIFASWCAANGLAALPAEPSTVARYLTARALTGAKVATIQAGRSAIAAVHRAAKVDNPCNNETVRSTVQGLARKHRSPRRQASPLTADDLAAILATARLPRRTARGMESAEVAQRRGAVDAAIAGVLFQAGLRRSEAAALAWGDIQPASQPGAFLVHVRASKTNRDGSRVDIRLVKNGAAKALAAIRPDDAQPSDRVFGLDGRTIARRLAAAAKAAGLEGDYSGHSGRVGLASELTARGASLQEVMLAGGWQSAAMVARYSAGATAEQGAVAKYL